MNSKDLRIDTYTNSSSKVDMRITYIPNGVYVEGSSVKGKFRLQEELIKELEVKLKGAEKPGPHIPEYTQVVREGITAILMDGNLLSIDELVKLLNVNENLLAEKQRVLDSIPECPEHGKNCVPHAIEWIDKMKENCNG